MSALPAPFHETPVAGAGRSRRLLLISYHFPPAQTAGALRWQKLSRYAAERGWGLDVISLDPSQLASRDDGRLTDLPAGVRVFGVRRPTLPMEVAEHAAWSAWSGVRRWRTKSAPATLPNGDAEPSETAGAARPASLHRTEMVAERRSGRGLYRAYHAWLEHARDGAWARRAAGLARCLAGAERYEAVLTCGPPHMVHMAGYRVSKRTGLPHVLDFRDPWSLVERLPEGIASPLWFQFAARYERRAVAAASLIVANTEPLGEAMRARYPDAADRVITVMNGCDDESLPGVERSARFLMAYAGTVYLDRDPRLLFRAAGKVVRELKLPPAEFGFALMGHVRAYNGVSVEDIARDEGLEAFVTVHTPQPRREALAFLAGAAMLVNLPQDSTMQIPSKIFEYMQFPAWLLAMEERGSATERLLRGSGADVLRPDDVEGMAAAIRSRVREYRAGGRPEPLAVNPAYQRGEQARILFEALERRVGAPALVSADVS